MSKQVKDARAARALVLRERARYLGLLQRIASQPLWLSRPEREYRNSSLRTNCDALDARHRKIIKGEKKLDLSSMFQPDPKSRTPRNIQVSS